MPNVLSTPSNHGTCDFLSNVITLYRFEERHKPGLEAAMAWIPGDVAPTTQMMESRAIIKHEVTHFLDLTTTRWGLQYTVRKQNLARCLARQEAPDEALRVFMLDTAEIEVHAMLLVQGKTLATDCDLMQHRLAYTKQFGAVLIVQMLREQTLCHEVPLSMLSLLEANATASEYLSRLSDLGGVSDPVQRRLDEEEIARSYAALLANPAGLEYSVLLHLARLHLDELTLREQLGMVAALARFALNVWDFGMAQIANRIQGTFKDPLLGESMCNDLRRGNQRALIFFKCLLFVHGWKQSMGAAQRDDYLALMRSRPAEAVRLMLVECLDMDEFSVDPGDFGAEMWVAMTARMTELSDRQILEASFAVNAPVLATRSAGEVPFRELLLLDMLLHDGTEVSSPQRLELGVTAYLDDHMQAIIGLEQVYRAHPHERFHLPLGTQIFPDLQDRRGMG